jgi:ribosome biogenesis GTPase / thiamine phosphate phosphatase
MNLSDLGFDDWFDAHAGDMLQPNQSIARVTAVDRDAFLVRDQHGERSAELAGKLRFSVQSSMDLPCVGDWVGVQQHTSGPAIIHSVLPRKSFLRRKHAGKTVDFQMIAANIDIAFIVQSCHYDFNIARLDRYLVMANEGHIEPFIILSKSDLISPEELEATIASIRQTGIATQVLALSNTTGHGLDAFRSLLAPGKTVCLLGSSGVGKTTLINRLMGRDSFETKAVSATGEGRHATTRRQLIVLDQGSMLMDMPGMRELGILSAGDGVSESFADIGDLAQSCRFSNCTHTQEPGCAVLAAIESGELNETRIQSYQKLKKESDYNEMSYLDKRKKDRAFGRFIKSVKKQKRR